jgi:uncharacterized membrane protein
MYEVMDMFICGFAGGVAALLAKLALDKKSPIERYCEFQISGPWENSCSLFLRTATFGLMLYANAIMLSRFLRALEKGSSLVVTVVSSSANMVTTGIFSQLIFGEEVEENWYLGAILISAGVTLVALSQKV